MWIEGFNLFVWNLLESGFQIACSFTLDLIIEG